MSEQEAWTMVNKIAKLIEERDALVAERDALQAFKDEALQTDWIARAEAAEAERDRLADNNKHTHANLDFCIKQRMGLEARVTELEADLTSSEAQVDGAELRCMAAEAEVHRLNHENGALEEEARALREALADIAEGRWNRGRSKDIDARSFARAALAAPTKEGT